MLPQITVFFSDLKNILLTISAFFSVSTVCMQLSILATAVVFILEVSKSFNFPRVSPNHKRNQK
jgi:hypothetical protein